jgi:DNA modification methylase
VSDRIAAIDLRRLPVEALKPHPRNPRVHPKVDSPLWVVMKKSLEADYFDPIVWNERNGCLVSGHLRLKILIELGYTHIDVVVVSYDEPTHYARMVAANRLLGEWEEAILASLAGDIEAAGLDAALAGYDHKSMLALLDCPIVQDDTPSTEELMSKAEQLQERWKVQPGDLYQIGEHRLLCGACESQDNWQRLLNGTFADMGWVDPPYNVAYDSVKRTPHEGKPAAKSNTILNDDLPTKQYTDALESWLAAGLNNIKPGGAIYIAHAESYGIETRIAAKKAGANIAQCLVWVKQAFTLSRQDYNWQHEPILYGWKNGDAHFWQGGYKVSTVIDDEPKLAKKSRPELIQIINDLRNERDTTIIREPRNVVSDLHPTVKPVQLVARHIWNSSKRGETVLELFGGSGTTLAAAEQTGRRCVATELDPKYCAVILERLTVLGLEAVKIP